jgi:hypothetical protein
MPVTAADGERGAKTLLRQNTVFQSVEDRDGYVEAGMEKCVHESMANLDELVIQLAKEA